MYFPIYFLLIGVLPVMLDFKDVACLGYVPPWYNVNSISLDNLTLTSSFGTIKNPCNLTTSVTVKASFKTLPTAALGATNVMFTLGTGPPSTLTFNVISNPLANSSNSVCDNNTKQNKNVKNIFFDNLILASSFGHPETISRGSITCLPRKSSVSWLKCLCSR